MKMGNCGLGFFVFLFFSPIVLNLRLELLLLVLNGTFWKSLEHHSIYDENWGLVFFLPLPLLKKKKKKSQKPNQPNRKPNKMTNTKKPPNLPHTQKRQRPHIRFNISNAQSNSFKSISWSVFFSEKSFAFLVIHFVLILWDFPTWSVFTAVTKDFSFCCWILLIFNTVKSDVLRSGLALKKKVLCIHMVTIKKLYIFVSYSEFKVILLSVALIFVCVF